MKSRKSILHKWHEALSDMSFIFIEEIKNVFRDQGVLIFFILVPLGYPLLYSWLYNNEAMKEVPTVFVDDSNSFLSREFIRQCDATEGIRLLTVAADMNEARELQAQQRCHGIVYIPSDFERDIRRGNQTQVSFFADMSGMLYYKAIFANLTDVSLHMGKQIQISQLGGTTAKENSANTEPLHYEAVQIFNPAGGYGSYLLPAVLILIIQQTLLLGIGLSAGTARESNQYRELVPVKRHYHGVFRIVIGKSTCYILIYLLMSTWITLAIPSIFNFVRLGDVPTITAIIVPYILACTFFGMALSGLVRYRENVILLVLFTSVPLLFLSGVSWPSSSMSGMWKALSYLFPSTFGINAFVKINTFGASITEIGLEYNILWLQAVIYFLLAVLVYWRQINLARTHALNRSRIMQLRKIVSENRGIDKNIGDV